jgi:hypothetical protein
LKPKPTAHLHAIGLRYAQLQEDVATACRRGAPTATAVDVPYHATGAHGLATVEAITPASYNGFSPGSGRNGHTTEKDIRNGAQAENSGGAILIATLA